jgi:7-cyano-7-deazaguanine reductase
MSTKEPPHGGRTPGVGARSTGRDDPDTEGEPRGARPSGVDDELAGAPLGHLTTYPDAYDPALLYPVDRAPQRRELGLRAALPFGGADLWTAYELTWLDARGKPVVAIATFVIPVTSPFIVESKSVKLYLGSFAQTRYDDAALVTAALQRDLGAAVGAPVEVRLITAAAFGELSIGELAGDSLDLLPVAIDRYQVDPDALASAGPEVEETLRTDLFRSVCPVTGQPDFASVCVTYRGPRIDRAGLLRYLVSYRCHAGFHEHCVERIFVDLQSRCRCAALTVYARFTRRGGLDINPFRSTVADALPANVRGPRQ